MPEGATATADVVICERYALCRRIDSGAMAEVFLADDLRLGRQVAVKVLRPNRARDPRAVERFRREAQAAAALTHPNLVTVYDWGIDQGTAFLVMQYVAGADLRQVIRQRGPLPESEALQLAADIAAGLEVAHQHGIVHRDVKPRNVLIDSSGSALLADFGIAAPSDESADSEAVYGTALYISPEQARGLAVDGRGDLYSLGALMYELLTGSPPFRGDTAAEVAAQHVSAPVVAPRRIRPGLTAATEEVVLRALAKDPAARFGDAAEMRRALLAAARSDGAADAPGFHASVRVGHVRWPKLGVRPARVPLRWVGVAAAVAMLVIFALPLLATTRQASVPDVVGRPKLDAEAAVAAAGLTLDVDEQPTDDTPAGVVVRQDPGSDSRIGPGATVHAVVSSGLRVPDLGGRQCADARVELARAGWTVKPVRWRVANIDNFGKVVAQDPPAGEVMPDTGQISVQVAGPVRPC
jgi:serine/threonine-protein kinase